MLSRVVSRLASGVVPLRAYSSNSKLTFDVTDATFQKDVIEASHKAPIVLDAWADWCRPCKLLAPVLESAVAQHNGAVSLAKLNVDNNRSVHVEAIPAVFGYSKGKVVSQFVGAHPSGYVNEFVANLVATHNKK